MSYVKVGPFALTIIEVERLCDESGTKRLNGFIDHDQNLIKIDVGLGPQMKQHVVWHEVIHEILTQHSIKLGDNEEDVVDAIATGVMCVLQDNPAMRDDINFSSLVRQI